MKEVWEMIVKGLDNVNRLLIEASLEPAQGQRFQPTGFPNLGPAEFMAPDGTEMLLVESAQSMANRMEAVCWDEKAGDLIEPLRGLPYVKAALPDGRETNSLLEAHRLNSPYFFSRKKKDAEPLITEFARLKNDAFNERELASLAFKFDPNSVVHGVFLEKIAGGLRLKRALSGFIEARNVEVADSGGVKMDRVDPEGKMGAGEDAKGAKTGFGHVPFHRREFTAKELKGYFNLDLAQIRSYGLGENAERLLTTLSLFKIRKFLEEGLRLRTACDLRCKDLTVTEPKGWTVPPLKDLESDLREAIPGCKSMFATPPVTKVEWAPTKSRSKKGDESEDDAGE